jgi:4-hydroxy-tetrahydrodipicolinate synthase
MAGLASALPTARLMVGTGAAAITDAVALTRRAGELGFAGALLLPPFYYKGVPAEGVLAYLEVIARETADTGIALYLYNFPALSGVPYTPEIVAEAMRRIGPRLAGLKDSSGDLAYCRALAGLPGGLAVFPSNEAALIEARTGIFAGCISASANTNADLCHKAFHAADAAALGRAVAIRALFDGLNLVSAVKGLLSVMRNEPGLARTRPPLVALAAARSAELAEKAAAIRAG